MTDTSVERIAQLSKLFRVAPGSHVTLARDFDPAFKADFLNKKAGKKLHRQGVKILAAYQERLAAQDTHGVLLCLQALDAADHPSRHERREPPRRARQQLQGALSGRVAPRLAGRGLLGLRFTDAQLHDKAEYAFAEHRLDLEHDARRSPNRNAVIDVERRLVR